MSLPRILATNRRERGGRGPDATEVLLRFAIALLSFASLFRRREEAPKVKARLSVTEDERYREWARREAAG